MQAKEVMSSRWCWTKWQWDCSVCAAKGVALQMSPVQEEEDDVVLDKVAVGLFPHAEDHHQKTRVYGRTELATALHV